MYVQQRGKVLVRMQDNGGTYKNVQVLICVCVSARLPSQTQADYFHRTTHSFSKLLLYFQLRQYVNFI